MTRNLAVGGEASMRVPDYIEPTIGYRMWNVSQLDGRWYLSSIAQVGLVWPTDGPLRATHVGDGVKWLSLNIFHLSEGSVDSPPVAPVKGCACGIYAYAEPGRVMESVEGAVFRRVVGEVEMWGKVWEHDLGYRAEFARPRALWGLPGGIGLPAVQTLADRYGVPVIEP